MSTSPGLPTHTARTYFEMSERGGVLHTLDVTSAANDMVTSAPPVCRFDTLVYRFIARRCVALTV